HGIHRSARRQFRVALVQHHGTAGCHASPVMTAFISKTRHLRLLPGVMLVCGGLMVLKASGLVHDALAQENQPAAADAMAPAPKPVNQDFAGGDAQASSAAAVDVL